MEWLGQYILVILGCVLSPCSTTSYPKAITSFEFMDYFKNGSAVTYNVHIEKCHNQTKDIANRYSFGHEIKGGYITTNESGYSVMFYSFDSETDGTAFDIIGPVIRQTSISFHIGGLALIGMTDLDRTTWDVLDNSTVVCPMDTGNSSGFSLIAQTPPGTVLGSYDDVKTGLLSGGILHYAFDSFQCPERSTFKAHRIFGGRIQDYQIRNNGDIILMPFHLPIDENYIMYFTAKLTSTEDVTVDISMHTRRIRNQHQNTTTEVNQCKFGVTFNITKQG